METKHKISSIIIARDEENNIRRCIESQLNCIDEIILLVDNRTTDKTLEIANSYSRVKCELIKWLGYGGTKQYAVSLAKNEWIFWIDADEVITTNLSDELNDFKTISPVYPAYTVPRLAYFLGRWIKHSGWYPGRVTRLFNKNLVHFSQNNVHENLIFSGKAGNLNNDLLHYTDPSIRHYFEKFNNYTSLAADELVRKNKSFFAGDIIFRPFFIFIKMYFIKFGFLDGIQGFMLAIFSSSYVFTKYCKFWEAKKSGNNNNGKEVKK